MFGAYSRVTNDDSDDEGGTAARLLRETAAGPPPAVAPAVVTSTASLRGRTQQAVQQRKGGPASGSGGWLDGSTAGPGPASTSAGAGAGAANLIDFGDDPMPAKPAGGRPDSKTGGGRGGGAAPKQDVELVCMHPADPFEFLVQQTAAQPPPPTYVGSPDTSVGAGAGARPQHPLDFGFGDLASGGSASTSAAAAAPPAPAGGGSLFPNFGSFADLLGPLTGSAPAAAAASGAASTSAAGGGGGGGGGGGLWGFGTTAAAGAGAGTGALAKGHAHSQSATGIDDLLAQQRAMREAADGVGGGRPAPQHGLPPHGHGQGHGQHRAPAVFDPFGDGTAPSNGAAGPSSAPGAGGGGGGAYYSAGGRGSATASGDEAAGGATGRSGGAGAGADGAGLAPGEDPAEPGGGGGTGYAVGARELLLYAVPLFKDRLVFLPVVNWKDEEDTSTVLGKVNAGLNGVQQSISGMWHSLKDKGNIPAKIYKAGQAILENMNAEERLMRNIPKRANKLVVHHPSSVPPDEIQDQLTALTSTFCYKSAGKAAAAGVMLPVAVGLELIAVPGIGWYTAYQLFKSTSAAAGGSRLNQYLKSDKREVRICYAPEPKMDLFILKARLSPDGVLTSEDIEDFCHDLKEPQLLHPLTELRNRHLKKTQTMNADYALLPMNAPDGDDPYSSSAGGAAGGKKKD
ncbi:hypothetical protein HYH02_008033 [Chlamydomonas schloesseri]|uniref:Uncharacterized protein n=1 Tax=Chlamydomonas schloesseri TaxID=2026947 RepID=A0A835WG51_9CHLO|nr:hypothetical protein HYH02_008033 [Chlamydomonas schloesseri]|eukprot:KAG2446877.1 hypothetical protein HYH02_008033 [Chlamydomonas schloesseri]